MGLSLKLAISVIVGGFILIAIVGTISGHNSTATTTRQPVLCIAEDLSRVPCNYWDQK